MLGLILALTTLSGCGGTIRWRSQFEYEPTYEQSRREGKLTFVYLRSWYLVQCTSFEDEVLRDPAVVKATQPLNCVMLDFDSSGHLTRAWGLSEAPAFAIIGPDGTVRAAGSGRISKDELLTALRESLAATTQPSP